jgi:hypothetical protein
MNLRDPLEQIPLLLCVTSIIVSSCVFSPTCCRGGSITSNLAGGSLPLRINKQWAKMEKEIQEEQSEEARVTGPLRHRVDLPFESVTKETLTNIAIDTNESAECGLDPQIVIAVLRRDSQAAAYRLLKKEGLSFENEIEVISAYDSNGRVDKRVAAKGQFNGRVQITVDSFKEDYWVKKLQKSGLFFAVGRSPTGCDASDDYTINPRQVFGGVTDWDARQSLALNFLQSGVTRIARNAEFKMCKVSESAKIPQKPFTYAFTITGPSENLLFRLPGFWERMEMEVFFYDAGVPDEGSARDGKRPVRIRITIKRLFAVKSPVTVQPTLVRFEKDSESRLEDKIEGSTEVMIFLKVLADCIAPTATVGPAYQMYFSR